MNSPLSDDSVASLFDSAVGATVVMGVLVWAGKFKVMAGSGTKVVVGVSVGVAEGVKVLEGALVGLGDGDPVTSA